MEEATATFRASKVAERVTAAQVDARNLPFGADEFDAIVSIDAFEYFGTDVHFLPRLPRILKHDGQIGMTTPALRQDPYEHPVPDHVARVVGGEAAAWHAPWWWQRHWQLSGLVEKIDARWQDRGGADWAYWARAKAERNGAKSNAVLDMLEADHDENIGFAIVTARKRHQ